MLVRSIDMARRGGNPVKCVVWGNGLYSPEAPEITGLIQQLDLKELVAIRTWSEQQKVIESVARSIVYVSTSRYEGMPFSILEAMALGKAVIATDVDGNRDCVIPGKTGLLVPSDDSEALSRALLTLLNDRELCAEMGRRGRAEIETNFDIRRRISLLENIYERVAKREPGVTGG
jgi:glycosyltransferase involved in cell wall biosynthesis